MDEWKVIFTQLLADSGFFQTLYDAERRGSMTRIIEQSETQTTVIRFRCDKCKCVFETDSFNVQHFVTFVRYISKCPNCYETVIREIDKADYHGSTIV